MSVLAIVKAIIRIFCNDGQQQGPQQQQQQYPHAQQPHGPPHGQQYHGGHAPHQQHYPPQQQYPPPQQQYPPPQQQQQGGFPQAPAHQAHHQSRPGTNENLQNQQNPYYVDLRARARAAGDAMASAFAQAHNAHEAHDGARAKALSDEGHARQREMEALNAQAAEWIFVENNTDSARGEVDLHGLFVKEAITYTERAIVDARGRGEVSVRLIVGKGLHSSGHVAKLKPAIEELMRKHQLGAELDPHNAGVLVVHLDAPPQNRGMGADELSDRLENGRDGCIVM